MALNIDTFASEVGTVEILNADSRHRAYSQAEMQSEGRGPSPQASCTRTRALSIIHTHTHRHGHHQIIFRVFLMKRIILVSLVMKGLLTFCVIW